MTRKNKDSAKLTCRIFATPSGREEAGTTTRPIVRHGRKAFRCFSLGALFISSASVATLALAMSARAQDVTPVPNIDVNAPPPAESQSGEGAAQAAGGAAPEGSEAAGYKPRTVSSLGPFPQMDILDVPYSINVMSSALLENRIAGTADEALAINPFVQIDTPTISGRQVVILRGFINSFSDGRAEDGMRTQFYNPISIEDKERIEVLTGLTSFLYGTGNVGGLINYVYKKPTLVPLANITIGDYGGLAGFIHGDFGGPIDKDGHFAYRLNVVAQDGNTQLEGQRTPRQLVTAAVDWHLSENAIFELLGSHEYSDTIDTTGPWSPTTNPNGTLAFNYQSVPDSHQTFSQTYNTYAINSNKIEPTFSWKLNDIFTFRTAYIFRYSYEYGRIGAVNLLTSPDGAYNILQLNYPGLDRIVSTGYAFIDATFDTWSVHHNVTTGFYADTYQLKNGTHDYDVNSLTGYNFNDGQPYVPAPSTAQTTPGVGTRYTSTIQKDTNIVLGDEITFNKYVSALVGANSAGVISQDYNGTAPFLQADHYNEQKLTPSLSLIIKPLPFLSTYGTYSQSLEAGLIVPTNSNVIYTNAGQVLPPYLSKEYEIGAKANVGGLLLTAALFQIQKALQYSVTNSDGTATYFQDGREVHDGLELSATGNISEGFRIYSGLTLLDPKVTNNKATPIYNGKYPEFVANQMAKVTAEYDLPFAPGLTLTGGVYYTGKAAADQLNSQFIPAFTTGDIGLRYQGNLPTGQPVVFRLNVSNVTDAKYWLSPYNVGLPRTVAASAQIKF